MGGRRWQRVQVRFRDGCPEAIGLHEQWQEVYRVLRGSVTEVDTAYRLQLEGGGQVQVRRDLGPTGWVARPVEQRELPRSSRTE